MNEAIKKGLWRLCKWVVRTIEVLLVLLILMGLFGLDGIAQFIFLLPFGWIIYLHEVLPKVSINPEIALDAFLALALAVFGLHIILRWFANRRQGEPIKWRIGWTLKITAMVLMLFATSIAATGILHQTAWLFGERQWMETRSYLATWQLSNVKQLALGLRLYAGDHGGKFPEKIDELMPEYLPQYKVFFTKAGNGEPPERIIYYSGYKDGDSAELIVLASPSPLKGKRAVAHPDGSGELIQEEDFQQRIRKQEAARERAQ